MKPLLTCLALCYALFSMPIYADESAQTPVDITFAELSGGEIDLAGLRDQWVVLNYWATWCAPCRKEIPDLSELHDRREDITVLGLAFEDIEPVAIEEFLVEIPASYPIVLVDVFDPPQPFGPPRALPTTHIIDPRGVNVKTFVGPITGAQIEDFIREQQGP